jgi:hypothetical protein
MDHSYLQSGEEETIKSPQWRDWKILREVVKKLNYIMEDTKLKKKLISINVNDEFNEIESNVATERYKNIKAWLQEMKDPSPKLTPTWLN